MNIFRIAGDMLHVASIFILIRRIHVMKSCRGLSLKTQALYALVFLTRYVDVLFHVVSVYNTVLKLFFILSSLYIVYLIVYQFKPMDHEISTDTFPVLYILIPCGILSLIVNYQFSFMEILWSFSILLEAVLFLPQLHMLRITGQAEALTRYYIITIAWYRAMYIPNWIYRFATEGMTDPIAVVCGVIQSCVIFYFIFVYYEKYPVEKDIESEPSRGPAEYNDQHRQQEGESGPGTTPTPSDLEAGRGPKVAAEAATPVPKAAAEGATTSPEAVAEVVTPAPKAAAAGVATPAPKAVATPDPVPPPKGGSAFTVGDAEDAGADV